MYFLKVTIKIIFMQDKMKSYINFYLIDETKYRERYLVALKEAENEDGISIDELRGKYKLFKM